MGAHRFRPRLIARRLPPGRVVSAPRCRADSSKTSISPTSTRSPKTTGSRGTAGCGAASSSSGSRRPTRTSSLVEGTLLTDADETPVELGAGGPDEGDERADPTPVDEVRGILEVTRQRYGFLRLAGLESTDGDVYISAAQVRRCELRPGDEVAGPAREPRRGERHRALVHVDTVNGVEPLIEERPLTSTPSRRCFPSSGSRSMAADADVLTRAVDLLAPFAYGQRVLVRAARTLGPHDAAALVRAGRRGRRRPRDRACCSTSARRRRPLGARRCRPPSSRSRPATSRRSSRCAPPSSRSSARAGWPSPAWTRSSSATRSRASPSPPATSAEVKRLFGSGRNLAGGGSLTRRRDRARRRPATRARPSAR